MLYVSIRAEEQFGNVPGSGWQPMYSQIYLAVKVEDFEQFTPILDTGAEAPQETSPAINLSGAFTKECGIDEPASICSQEVEVCTTRPNYDYWCYNFPTAWECLGQDPASGGFSHVHPNHPWSVTTIIQTDYTL